MPTVGFDVRGDSPQSFRALSWEAERQVPAESERSFERGGALRWSLMVLLAMAVLGVIGGLLWSMLADPPGYTVSRDAASMGEAESSKQFGVEVVYAGIAALLGLAAGLVAGWRLARYGWVLVLTLTLGGLAAALSSLLIGRWLGPPEPSDVIGAAAVGTVVPDQLMVQSAGLLLIWPAAALAGLLLAVGVFARGSSASTTATKGPQKRAGSD